MQFPLKLKNYFFTHQEVIANPSHDESAETENNIDYDIAVETVNISENSYGVNVKIYVDVEKNQNAPYFFTIAAFGFIEVNMDQNKDITNEELKKLISSTGVSVLVGAIRERLADMTARGPWAVCYLDILPLTEKK